MAGENLEFILFVKAQRCCMWMQDPCEGPTEAHHAGERGMGQKAHDETCVPLCTKHHRGLHDANGIFKRWTKKIRKAWVARQIEWTRTAWDTRPVQSGKRLPVGTRFDLDATPPRKRRSGGKYRCSVCGAQGHSKRTCPRLSRRRLIAERVATRKEPQ